MRVSWTSQARDNAAEIAGYIARDNAAAAGRWLTNLASAVSKLRALPRRGRVVPEFGLAELREVPYGEYRVIYRLGTTEVAIITIYHARRLLTRDALTPAE